SSGGSSSTLVRRSTRPKRVTRASSLHVTWGPEVAVLIDRNLYSTNGLSPAPTRTCRKRIGPRLVSFTATATPASKGERTGSNTIDAATSSVRRLRPTVFRFTLLIRYLPKGT